jgi:hypothetical protein
MISKKVSMWKKKLQLISREGSFISQETGARKQNTLKSSRTTA